MGRTCFFCGVVGGENLLACPACKRLYGDSDKIVEAILKQHEKQTTKNVLRRLIAPFAIAFSIFSAITGFGLWQIYVSVRDAAKAQVSKEIAKEFDEPSVRATLLTAASEKAADLIAQTLRPVLEKAQHTIEASLEGMNAKVKAVTEPRTINAEQRDKVVACLTGAPKGQIKIVGSMNDWEANVYAQQLSDVFSASGFTMPGGMDRISMSPPGVSAGIINRNHVPEHAMPVLNCLRYAGILTSPNIGSGPYLLHNDENDVILVVGPKS